MISLSSCQNVVKEKLDTVSDLEFPPAPRAFTLLPAHHLKLGFAMSQNCQTPRVVIGEHPTCGSVQQLVMTRLSSFKLRLRVQAGPGRPSYVVLTPPGYYYVQGRSHMR
ncbi:hypothetical protein CY34DRAFT_461675 [Suillus luteus UH-Slu-Lm8-n1]|uniref:Uncharacterized protein n=1 Tax=Suillus luteus UH-Slu-Lm8-n1 TaxID=930992 RepID=A0A0D0A709_9AGAM|nr:hypothetical protein CY34DRAFT_461675 [Suillus luteus UH-Slu-Lm8-n1]